MAATEVEPAAMETRQVATRELAVMAAPYNPRRKMTERELGSLRRSLSEFGTVEPVVVNKRTWRIVGGHQRVRAAQAEGLESLPVVLVDLPDEREKALNIALNRISGGWDDEKLGAVMAELDAKGFDLGLTGFEVEETERIVGAFDVGEGSFPSEHAASEATHREMVVTLSSEQYDDVQRAVAKARPQVEHLQASNASQSGNAVYLLVMTGEEHL